MRWQQFERLTAQRDAFVHGALTGQGDKPRGNFRGILP